MFFVKMDAMSLFEFLKMSLLKIKKSVTALAGIVLKARTNLCKQVAIIFNYFAFFHYFRPISSKTTKAAASLQPI